MIVNDISEIDLSNLKKNGIKFIVFDKDNTLTKTYDNYFYNEKII